MASRANFNICQRFKYGIVTNTETFFYKLGVKIGARPWSTITICWGIVLISALGFLRFHQEKNPMKLWVPPHTDFLRDSDWLMRTLQLGYRSEIVLLVGDNVLSPQTINLLADLDGQIEQSRSHQNITWNDVCFKIPKLDQSLLKMFLGNEHDASQKDSTLDINPMLYCSFVESFQNECLKKSILDLWDFNRTKIAGLTQDDIIYAVNSYEKNSIFGNLKEYEDLLGGVVRNESGYIIGAKALHNFWMVNVNFSSVDMNKVGNIAGTADWASEESLDWENTFLEIVSRASSKLLENGTQILYNAGRSFGDISGATMFQDMDKLVLGVFIMIVYIQLVISKFSWVECRVLLGMVGLLTIGMAFVVGCGLCSLLGVYYGPVHTSLPFLLMGLGVDDMLVILACWDDINKKEKQVQALPERIGLMLKHAGVSITVTSITDVVAFIIGSSTILPCLQSFCIYAGAGVFMIYIFAVTFFTACLTIDQTRLEDNRNGLIPCIVHKKTPSKNGNQKTYTERVIEFAYNRIIFTWPAKFLIIFATLVSLGFSVESSLKLEKRFDPKWFIPKNTYMSKYLESKYEYFPEFGFEGGLYVGAVNYPEEFRNIAGMVEELRNMTDITDNIVSWVEPFRDFVLVNFHEDLYEITLDDVYFKLYLSKFLFSPFYAKYQANFEFIRNLECGVSASDIIMSRIDFNFKQFSGPNEYIPAMHKVRNIVYKANFTSEDRFATVWSKIFATWITDELIDVEVMRNLQLALLCVMACTIILIADWQICFWIFVCVLITMVNVTGFMQRWGLTIDLVSCIGLELAIGLCVDYAAHIGHTFLTVHKGEKRQRALETVRTIGSAVLYGGLSTLIGVFMLSQSNAYTFQAFFKIFLLVIFFGMFHGIVLLPVILSWIGPKPYRSHNALPQCDTELT